MLLIQACGEALRPDAARTMLWPLDVPHRPTDGEAGNAAARLVSRLLSLSSCQVEQEVADAVADAASYRHHDVDLLLRRRFHALADRFPSLAGIDEARARLVALFFSREVAIEARALLNPSVVTHFDQSGLGDGDLRFVLSLRGVGEGQLSSLIFQTGVWRHDGSVELDARGRRATGPRAASDGSYDPGSLQLAFAQAPLSERVIPPFWRDQGGGLGDARFCRFVERDGSVDYRCTFVSFDEASVRQDVLVTADFRAFEAYRLDGILARPNGGAWFPRRIGDYFAMLGHSDDGSISLFASDDGFRWGDGRTVVRPEQPWELAGLRTCGSPIELAEGWLVLVHGVGRAQRHCLGAVLLDRDDPGRLLARTPWPFLEPAIDDERGEYVPATIGSLGALLRARRLLLPYSAADSFTAFANVDVDDLLATMVWLL